MKNKIYSFSLMIFSLLISKESLCQTNPTPFDLSSGNYSFSSWDSAAAAGTYPTSMIFHFINNPTDSLFDPSANGNSDWDCVYNRSSRNRILGLGSDGFAFVATSSPQFNDCIGTDSIASESRYVGAAVLGLNTIGRSNIQVSWTGGTITPGDGNGTATDPRIFSIRLQYRIGNSGNYIDVAGPAEYISSQSAGDIFTVGQTLLPSICENEVVVQLRWIYFQTSSGGGGTRPKMSVDEINVTSDSQSGIDESNLQNIHVTVYPNPSTEKIFINISGANENLVVSIADVAGRRIYSEKSFSQKAEIDVSAVSKGIYIISLLNKEGKEFFHSPLVIE